jgi:NADPH:quinone reductase-like Zn-dependent oxidoreductase
VAKANLTVPRPPEVSAAEGAGLPAAGLMAYQAVTDSAGIKLSMQYSWLSLETHMLQLLVQPNTLNLSRA